jgi:hydroxymethylpyrimidine pyrophosphatase-like HAD family hydrolase
MNPKAVAFDLDGTLAESKQGVDVETAMLLTVLAHTRPVVVISGGSWAQFSSQLLPGLPLSGRWTMMPCSGAQCLAVRKGGDGWTHLWHDVIPEVQRRMLVGVMGHVGRNALPDGTRTWGPQVEDRGGQVTLSLLGQGAPPGAKAALDPVYQRYALEDIAARVGHVFDVRAGGTTSVDVTLRGLDKGSSMRRLLPYLGLVLADVLFVGDRLDPGGNDRPVMDAGFECRATSGPVETREIIRGILAGG